LLWTPQPNCNCTFFDLFERNPLFDVFPQWYERVAHRVGCSPFRDVTAGCSVISQAALYQRKYTIDVASLEDCPTVLFKGCFSDFIPSHFSAEEYARKVHFYLNQLVPRKDLARRLFALPAPTVGVHIRRTDNKIAAETSRLEDYITHMKDYVEEQPQISFFLATDEPAVEAALKAVFGQKIITFPKSAYRRSESAAIGEALIDLLLLSRCDRILGSYYSTFSDYASMFRRVELLKVGVGIWKGPAHDILHRAEPPDKGGTLGRTA
jgi:hypothetical protein